MGDYNGWSSWDAWDVALWLDNTERFYKMNLENHKFLMEKHVSRAAYETVMVRHVCEMFEDWTTPDGAKATKEILAEYVHESWMECYDYDVSHGDY